MADRGAVGTVFDLDNFAVHDGPGIRLAVYFKGCPLRCRWCHSPESQARVPELIHLATRCTGCGACVAACGQGVHRLAGTNHSLDRSRCLACGDCVRACPNAALEVKGETTAAADVVARAVRLKPFFAHSGGGITLTGGEVTMQAEFAAAILAGCRSHGIHTAIETCGACPPKQLETVVEQADLILYDLKLMDEGEHRRWTGHGNREILANLRSLASRDVLVRVPLIPDVTDTDTNLQAILRFMQDVGLKAVDFLPYNPSADAKYSWLGREHQLAGEPQTPDRLAAIAAKFRRGGCQPTVAGRNPVA